MGVLDLFPDSGYLGEGCFALCMEDGGSRDYDDFIMHCSMVIIMQDAYATSCDAHMRNDLQRHPTQTPL